MITKILKKGKNSTISSLFAGIVVIMAMFLSVACEKDESSVANQQQTVRKPQPISDMEVMQYLPEVVDGRLVFKDTTSFMTYKRWIFENQGNPEKIHKINKSLGFVSMKEIYENGIQLLEDNPSEGKAYIMSYPNVFHEVKYDNSIIYEMQAPNTFAFIANSDGVFQWDKNIDRFTYNNYYSIMDGNSSNISVIVEATDLLIDSENISARALFDETKSEQQTSYNNVYFNTDSTTRTTARLVMGSTGYYYYYGAITNTQKKVLGVWIGKKLSNNGARISANGYWNTTHSIAYVDSDNQTASVVYYEQTFLPNFSTSTCQTIHTGIDGNGVVKTYVHANAFQPIY